MKCSECNKDAVKLTKWFSWLFLCDMITFLQLQNLITPELEERANNALMDFLDLKPNLAKINRDIKNGKL